MWNYLLTFIKNDLIFIAKLLAGVILVAHRLPVRRGIAARAAVVMVCAAAWSVLFQVWGTADPSSILIRSILKYICAFLLAIVCTMFCYFIERHQALFAVTVAYCLEHMAQRLQAILFHYLTNVPVEIMRLTELTIAAVMDAVLYALLIRHFICQENEERKSNILLVFLSLIVIGTDIILSTVGIDLIIKGGNSDMMILLSIFSIMISILVLIISMCDIRMKNAERDQLIVRQLLYSQKQQFRQDNAIRDVINIKCHDLKHQIQMLETKLDRQEMENIKKAVDVYDSSIATGNTALDVVLSNKALLCSQNDIRFTAVADGALLNFVKDSDIYSLFGNILDNAIYSAGKMEDRERRLVTLTVGKHHGFAFIHTENYFEGEMLFSDGLPQTTQQNKSYHGFGMLSIRTLAEKYSGDLKISAVSGVFKLDIMFPLPETSFLPQRSPLY